MWSRNRSSLIRRTVKCMLNSRVLRSGCASQAAMDRCVLRPLHLAGAADQRLKYGQDAVPALFSGSFQGAACSEGTIGPLSWRTCGSLICEAAARLAGTFVRAQTLLISFALPEDTGEDQLTGWIDEIGHICARCGMLVANADVQVLSGLREPYFTVTALGSETYLPPAESIPEITEKVPAEKTAGSLVMAGSAGQGGAAVLAGTFEKALLDRFPASLVNAARETMSLHTLSETACAAAQSGACRMYAAGEGGVFGALWKMGELLDIGFEADLRSIPIRQETVEICEFLDVNPYQLYGLGAMLIITPKPQILIRTLRERNIPAALIGRVTDGKARILKNGEETRYLDKTGQDELVRVWGECRKNGKAAETAFRERTDKE